MKPWTPALSDTLEHLDKIKPDREYTGLVDIIMAALDDRTTVASEALESLGVTKESFMKAVKEVTSYPEGHQ